MSENPQSQSTKTVWTSNRPPAHPGSAVSNPTMKNSTPVPPREGQTESELLGPRAREVRHLDPGEVADSSSGDLEELHCPVDSENFSLFLSHTQPIEICPQQLSDTDLQEIYRALTVEEEMTIWGPRSSPCKFLRAKLLAKIEDSDWRQYVVFNQLITSAAPITMRLDEIVHIQIHGLDESEISGEAPLQQEQQTQSQSQGLYPSLHTHWQELGIPLTSSGEIDVMQVQVMYHFGHEYKETENEYRRRIGIDAYMAENKVTENVPILWRQIQCVLPEKSLDIKMAWFNTFQQHQLTFSDWWTTVGSNLPWTEWPNGQVLTYGQELNFRIQQIDTSARTYINNAPNELKPKLVELYGPWSLTLITEHFSQFEDYCNLQPEFVNAKLATISEDTSVNNEYILPDTEIDDWRLYESKDWEVTTKTMPMFFKKYEPSTEHLEKLIMTDSIYSQTMMDPKCQIEVADFLPFGRLCHIFVPNYVYVPPLAAELVTGVRDLSAKDRQLLWRRMHHARNRAATLMAMSNDLWGDNDKVDPLPKLSTYWRTEIQNAKTTEFPLQNIDEVQHVHSHLTTMEEHFKTNKSMLEVTRDLYDLFIRPMERLFTCDMPMSAQILLSQHDVVKQKWLFSTIAKFSGYYKWPKMCTVHILRELSRIRTLYQEVLNEPFSNTWSPVARKNSMYFAATPSPTDIFDDPPTDWMVSIDDFYPGGRLYGIHVRADRKLAAHIIHRFSRKTITSAKIRQLHNEIITTRAQWSHQVVTQLAIQNGKDPYTASGSNPAWIRPLTEMSDRHFKKAQDLSYQQMEDKCRKAQLTVTDFYVKGRLETYPTEGAKHLTKEILRNLELPDYLPRRDTITVISFINKFIREHHSLIVEGRQREKAAWLQPQMMDPKVTYAQYRNAAKPTFAPKTQSQTLARMPPTPTKTPTKRQASTSNSSASATTQEAYEVKVIMPPSMQKMQMKKEKEMKLGNPPPEYLPKPKPLFPAEPLFQPKTIPNENPFLWNGSPQTAPRWALQNMSSDMLHEMKENRTPSDHRARLVVTMCHRQIPLDGVNRILDVYMNKYGGSIEDLREFGIEITSVSKERGVDSNQSETRTMKIPFLDTANVVAVLRDVGRALLPPAVSDSEREDQPLVVCNSRASHFTYRAEVVLVHAAHGVERLLAISQQNYETKHFAGFSIPWRYTSLFLIKFESIKNEAAFMQNEWHRVKQGVIPEPQPFRMNRTELLNKEDKSIRFAETKQ